MTANLITTSEISVNSLMSDLALQRSALHQTEIQLLVLREGLELPHNPVVAANRLVEHTVVAGETLPEIARMYYDAPERWVAIAQENAIESPYTVWAGQALLIPGVNDER